MTHLITKTPTLAAVPILVILAILAILLGPACLYAADTRITDRYGKLQGYVRSNRDGSARVTSPYGKTLGYLRPEPNRKSSTSRITSPYGKTLGYVQD